MIAALHLRKKSPIRSVFFLPWISFAHVLSGILAVTYASFVVIYGEAYQAIELRKFEHPASLTEPRVLLNGDVIGEIQIPRLAVKAVVVQGDDLSLLDRAIGHLPETAMPGEWGNVALAGHRDRLFRPLRDIQSGDTIFIDTPSQLLQYRVQSTFVVSATQLDVLRQSDAKELTLITCFPFTYIGRAPNRFIVRARQVASRPK
jgi:sortase A